MDWNFTYTKKNKMKQNIVHAIYANAVPTASWVSLRFDKRLGWVILLVLAFVGNVRHHMHSELGVDYHVGGKALNHMFSHPLTILSLYSEHP